MSNPQQVGSYIPSTQVWDVSEIYDLNIDPKLRELLIRLYQNLNMMAINVNLKDTGYYDTQPFVNSQLFFPNPLYTSMSTTYPAFRQVFRQVLNFGALPNTGSKSVAHNITCTPATTFTRIYATASDTTTLTYIPIPYASPVLANAIELSIDSTNVTITTGSNRSNFNVTYVIVEWLSD